MFFDVLLDELVDGAALALCPGQQGRRLILGKGLMRLRPVFGQGAETTPHEGPRVQRDPAVPMQDHDHVARDPQVHLGPDEAERHRVVVPFISDVIVLADADIQRLLGEFVGLRRQRLERRTIEFLE